MDTGYRYTAGFDGGTIRVQATHVSDPERLLIWAQADQVLEAGRVVFRLFGADEVTRMDGWIDDRGLLRARANIEAPSPRALAATTAVLEHLHFLVVIFRKAAGRMRGLISLEDAEVAGRLLCEASRLKLAEIRRATGTQVDELPA